LALVVALACSSACHVNGARHKAAGNVLFKRGDLDGALREYQEALKEDPKDPNAYTLIGNVRFEQGELTGAYSAYQKALSLDDSARAARQGMVAAALRDHDYTMAKTMLREMVDREPRDSEAHTALGKLLYREEDLDGAERHLRDALTVAQNDPAALYVLGLVLAKKQQQEQANAIFDRLERVAPGKSYAAYGRAVAAARSGHDDEALKWLAQAIRQGIDDAEEIERDVSFGALKRRVEFQELVSSARKRAPPH
jgi:tetratricopeptide (TPR) repeat protein